MSVTRSVVLIGFSGGNGTAPLYGIRSDLKNVNAFVQSPRYGCHYANEIITLLNPTIAEVQMVLEKISTDLTTIYYSGHGAFDRNLGQMICLTDGKMALSTVTTKSKIQCVIIDACRTYLARISGLPEYFDYPEGFDYVTTARIRFDEYIEAANKGRIEIYSSKIGTPSYDTNFGGTFTLTYLQLANEYWTPTEHDPVFVESLLPCVSKRMNMSEQRQQVPCFHYTQGYNMPILLGAPYVQAMTILGAPKESDFPKEKPKQENPLANALAAGVVIWGLWSLFRN